MSLVHKTWHSDVLLCTQHTVFLLKIFFKLLQYTFNFLYIIRLNKSSINGFYNLMMLSFEHGPVVPDLSLSPSLTSCSLRAIDRALIWIFSDSTSYAAFLTVSLTSLVRPIILDNVLVEGAIQVRTALLTSGFGSQFSRNKYAINKRNRTLCLPQMISHYYLSKHWGPRSDFLRSLIRIHTVCHSS